MSCHYKCCYKQETFIRMGKNPFCRLVSTVPGFNFLTSMSHRAESVCVCGRDDVCRFTSLPSQKSFKSDFARSVLSTNYIQWYRNLQIQSPLYPNSDPGNLLVLRGMTRRHHGYKAFFNKAEFLQVFFDRKNCHFCSIGSDTCNIFIRGISESP